MLKLSLLQRKPFYAAFIEDYSSFIRICKNLKIKAKFAFLAFRYHGSPKQGSLFEHSVIVGHP